MASKIFGVILCALGSAAGIWVITRLTHYYGRLLSWKPPFNEYETTTIGVGIVALLFIIVGLISLTKKKNRK